MSRLAEACVLSHDCWIATFPEIIPEAEYTKNHEKWKRKLFDKMRGNRYHHFTTRTVKVMLVAAVLSALLLTAFVIPSSREFIIDNLGIYSTYELTKDNGNSVNGEIIVGYIPEGFELENKESFSKSFMCSYVSNQGVRINIYKNASSASIDFDTESIEAEEIVINNITYTYCLSVSHDSSIIWTQNDYVYRVNGQIPRDEMIKIAETVK